MLKHVICSYSAACEEFSFIHAILCGGGTYISVISSISQASVQAEF
jgi:hypothetical protein